MQEEEKGKRKGKLNRRQKLYIAGKITRSVIRIAVLISFVSLLIFTIPYVNGTKTFEDPMDPSQMQGLLFMIGILFLMKYAKI